MRFTDILLEYNRDATVKNYGQKVIAAALTDRSVPWLDIFADSQPHTVRNIPELLKNPELQQKALDYIMGIIEQSDPTKNKNYAQAIARLYSLGGTMLEDIQSTLSQYLVKFDKLNKKKKIQPPYNDFMRYKSLNDFMTAVEGMPDPDSEVEQQKIGELELPPHNEWRYVYGRMDAAGRILTDCVVVTPLTRYAAYWWAKEYPKKGVTNRWCTAWEGENSRFEYYNKQGPLYIIIPAQRDSDNEKYQFHFPTKQFMDYQDHQIGDDGINALVSRFPAIANIFVKDAVQNNILGLMPQTYKDAIRSHSRVAAEELTRLITQYQDRIAAFGFNSMTDYGISIPEETQQQLIPLISEYLDEILPALVTKGGFWSQIVGKLGSERSEDRLEVFLNTDTALKSIMEHSQAGQAVADLAQTTEIRKRVDASHLQDLLLRDPLFRFIMRQVPKLYAPLIEELTGQLQNISEGFDSKQEMIAHFVATGRTAAQGAAAWERTQGKTGTKKKPNPFDPNYKVKPVDNSRYGEKDLDEDDWHGAGDDWHGAGNDPVDAWHSPEGEEAIFNEDWQKVNQHDKTDGMSHKAVSAYRREHPGSKLKTAVTTKPSKLKPGSKAAKRRKSFCARMSGNKGPMKDEHGKPTAKAKALRRWNCESTEDVKDLLMIAESIRRGIK